MDRRSDSPDRRTARPDVEGTHQAALMIDFDNVTMGIRSNLGQELRTLLNSDVIRGKVAVQRAYADWRRYPQYIVPLSEASIDLIFAPAYGSSKKNATDIRLAIDALELVFVRPEIRTFILMSGDSDFSSLVLKLKEYGKYVIGVGIQESSSDLLVQNCDEYYSYSALTGLSKSGDQPAESHDPWVLIEKAVNKMVERGDTMRSDRLKQVMIEIDPSFNEKEQGFNKFNRFVVEAASRGLVSIQKMENGQYGVAPASAPVKTEKPQKREKTEKAERKETKPREARGRKRGERRTEERPTAEAGGQEERTRRARPKLTMKSGLDLLGRALDALLEGEAKSVRDSDVKRKLLEFDSAFDEGELGFSKFSKFLQAAEEQGAIELTRGPQGNYHVAPAKASTKRKRGPIKQDQPPEPDKSQAEGTMQRLARFLFGERKLEEEEAAAVVEAETKTAEPSGASKPSGAAEAAKPGPRRSERGGRGRRERAPARTPADGPAAERPRRESPDRSERRSRGEARGGRRGGGSRGGPGRQRAEGRVRQERSERSKPEATERPLTSGQTPSGPSAPPEDSPAATAVGMRDAVREHVEDRPAQRPPERETAEAAPAKKPDFGHEAAEAVKKPSAEAVEKPSAEAVDKTSAEAVDKPSAEAVEKTSAGAESKDDALSPAPLPGAPRGTIRGRWGARGRYRPAGAPPPIFEGQTSRRSEGERAGKGSDGLEAQAESRPAPGESSEAKTEASWEMPVQREAKVGSEEGEAVEPSNVPAKGAGDAPVSPATGIPNSDLVNRLTGYSGVGRRTAESLVEAFGADVFRVLDEEPARVREILPDHRAERVLEERRRELSAGRE